MERFEEARRWFLQALRDLKAAETSLEVPIAEAREMYLNEERMNEFLAGKGIEVKRKHGRRR